MRGFFFAPFLTGEIYKIIFQAAGRILAGFAVFAQIQIVKPYIWWA